MRMAAFCMTAGSVPMATVKTASIMAGSARAAMVISRLLPRPPNGLPASRPLSATKKRPRPSR